MTRFVIVLVLDRNAFLVLRDFEALQMPRFDLDTGIFAWMETELSSPSSSSQQVVLIVDRRFVLTSSHGILSEVGHAGLAVVKVLRPSLSGSSGCCRARLSDSNRARRQASVSHINEYPLQTSASKPGFIFPVLRCRRCSSNKACDILARCT